MAGSSKGRSVRWDAQRCVNLYPELDEKGVNIAALVGTPGCTLFATIPKTPYRGHWVYSDTQLFVVYGSGFYEISTAGVVTSRGTLTSSTGRVSMADNGTQIMLSDGAGKGYIYTLSGTSFAAIGDADAPTSDNTAYLDQYFIANKQGTFSYQISALADGTSWVATDITSSDGDPDPITAIRVKDQKLLTFGPSSIESYYDSGNATFPFDRISGSLIECGTPAPWTIAQLASDIIMLGADEDGIGVFLPEGDRPKRVSPAWLEYLITGYGSVSDATAFTYVESGHQFYVLTFPSVPITWCYDKTTDAWHQRQTFGIGRWLADGHAYFNAAHYVFDATGPYIHTLTDSAYTDNGVQIQRIRAGRTIAGEDLQRIPHDKFDVWFEPGIDNASATAPQAIMRYSDDGGFTWSNERWSAMQLRGDYKGRCRWLRNGQARERVYEVTVSDPVKVVMVAAVINGTD